MQGRPPLNRYINYAADGALYSEIALIWADLNCPPGDHHQLLPVCLTSHQHCSQCHVNPAAFGETGVQQWSRTDGLPADAEVHRCISPFVCLLLFRVKELCVTKLSFNPGGNGDEAGEVRVPWSQHTVATLRLSRNGGCFFFFKIMVLKLKKSVWAELKAVISGGGIKELKHFSDKEQM